MIACNNHNLRTEEVEEVMMNNRRFYNFPRISVAVYFTYFESITVYRSTRRVYVVCLKRHPRSGVSSRFVCIGLMGVSAPSLHTESTDSMIYV